MRDQTGVELELSELAFELPDATAAFPRALEQVVVALRTRGS